LKTLQNGEKTTLPVYTLSRCKIIIYLNTNYNIQYNVTVVKGLELIRLNCRYL